MWNNKKKLLILVVIAGLLGSLIYGMYLQSQKNTEPVGDLESEKSSTLNETQNKTNSVDDSQEWITYEVGSYNFSLEYPKDDFIFTEQDSSPRFLRIQNYEIEEASGREVDKYWVEFFAFDKSEGLSSCTQNMTDFSVSDFDGMKMYKGIAKVDEGSGVGEGLQAVCLERQGFDLYMQGQDNEAGTFGRILDSIKF